MNALDNNLIEYKDSIIKQIGELYNDLYSKINFILQDPNITSKITPIEIEYQLFDCKRKEIISEYMLKIIKTNNK
jgi:hypothetical protein